jgi:hypothetical protein
MLHLLEGVRSGSVRVEEAMQRLSTWPVDDLGHTLLDTQRAMRCGHPEVVYGANKSPEQLVEIACAMAGRGEAILVTRASAQSAAALKEALPSAQLHPTCGAVYVPGSERLAAQGCVMVVSAGTSDAPVAEEAAVTARAMGAKVDQLADVGVAGIHRLLGRTELLRKARVVVVVAGMEGALPSVVGGLVETPVIAVPTSVGYGASFGGLAALLAMLNSCAAGVLVTNIDNGFGAGVAAARINRLQEPAPR